MDLLDLEIDLNVEAAPSTRVTRRSQAIEHAASSTPKQPAPKAQTRKAPTPKTLASTTPTAKAPTSSAKNAPTTVSTPKTPATSKKVGQKSAMSTLKEEVKPETAPKTVEKSAAKVQKSESPSHEGSSERNSRSPSTEKRSRNKAKKRFSPSPDIPSSKKRKMIAASQTPITPASQRTSIRIATKAEFDSSLQEFNKTLKARGPEDFDIPEEWKTQKPSDTVEEIIRTLTSASNNTDNSDSNIDSTTTTTDAKKATKKAKATHSSAPVDSKPTPTAEMPRKRETTDDSGRCRTYSRELGVDDFRSSSEDAPGPAPLPTPKTPKTKSTPAKAPASKEPEARATRRKSAIAAKNQKDAPDTPEPTKKVDSPVIRSSKRKSAAVEEKKVADPVESLSKVPRKSILKSTSKYDQEPSTSSASSAEPIDPNSALAIKQRLLGGGPASAPKIQSPKVKKVPVASAAEAAPVEQTAAPLPSNVDSPKGKRTPRTPIKEENPVIPKTQSPQKKKAPTAPASAPAPAEQHPTPSTKSATPQKPTPAALPATRASARVSKPNRLYADQTFNTEILGRARISEQNPAKEAHAREEPLEMPELPSSSIARRKSTNAPRPPATPKPVPVVNGVFRGYVPSIKVPIPNMEIDGIVVNLNDDVAATMDKILMKVCKDGVQHHEDIDPKVVKAKLKTRMDNARRVKLEAKKLDIQMKVKIPTTSEELGKRKRHAPKTDDFYWTPPTNRSKLKGTTVKEGEREETPPEDQDPIVPAEEKKQQKARDVISHLFDAEMDAAMKEAKKYSVSFDKYIRPKIETAQKRADIKLMSRKRQSTQSDDFYYHELLVDQLSPSNSNVENQEELDILGGETEPEDVPSQEESILIRTEALDIAEQIAVLIPRTVHPDGRELTIEEVAERSLEHVESRRACVSSVMEIIRNQLAHETAPSSGDSELRGCMWHTVTSANAQQLKNVYTISNPVSEDVISWTHRFALENLPVHVLASYLSVLRYSRRIFKVQSPATFGFITSSTDISEPVWSQVTDIVRSFVYKRGTEPGTEVLNNTIPYHRMSDTVFLLVSPTLTFGDQGSQSRPRHHGRIFRWLQSIGHLDSETISFNNNDNDIEEGCSVAEFLSDVIIDKICDAVKQKNKELPDCKVVLVGYGATTYLAHRAANLVGGIWAIISIGFPVMTPFGRRGTADDEILLTYCPTLFIVGAEGQRFNNEAMAELRSSMFAPTGLVVVGHSTDLLLVPTSVLLRLGISQTVVFRIILEKILDFLNLDEIRQQTFTDLVPMELNNIYELDQQLLKSDKALSGLAFATSSASSSAAASPVGAAGRRATVSGAGGDDGQKKKREVQPGHLAPSPRDDESFLAFQNLVTSTVATADDMPRRASLGSSVRVVERGDFRDHHRPAGTIRNPLMGSLLQPAAPRGPVDPASISLI